jgi:hypothetical protein
MVSFFDNITIQSKTSKREEHDVRLLMQFKKTEIRIQTAHRKNQNVVNALTTNISIFTYFT